MVQRIKCTVAYDGTQYNGFQRQRKGITIQGVIEKALAIIHKEDVVIHGSGRTDAGVHAINQVFHFETTLDLSENQWKRAINSLLPKDIYIKSVEIKDDNFHARYSVCFKEYRYYVSLGDYNPLQANYVYHYPYTWPLNIPKMQEAIKLLEGEHDFVHFTRANANPNTIRTIYKAEIIKSGGQLEFRFIGNGFLRGQVRVMVGTLLEIGEGKRESSTIVDLLSLTSEHAGRTAKAHGLYLYNVNYTPY